MTDLKQLARAHLPRHPRGRGHPAHVRAQAPCAKARASRSTMSPSTSPPIARFAPWPWAKRRRPWRAAWSKACRRISQLQGVLAAPHDALADVPGFRAIGAAHPVPDEGSFAAARAILDLLAGADAQHARIFPALRRLLGAGRIAARPGHHAAGLAAASPACSVNCGAPIDEINAVRKHLSAVKGGRLAAAAPAAMKLSLGVTDVPQGRESALASGPRYRIPPRWPTPAASSNATDCCPAARGDSRQIRAPGNHSRDAQGGRSGLCPRAFCDAARNARPVPSRAPGGGSARLRHRLRQHHRRLAHRKGRRFPARQNWRGCVRRDPAAAWRSLPTAKSAHRSPATA